MKAVEEVESNYDGHQLFRIAKQKVKESRDMLSVNCLYEEKVQSGHILAFYACDSRTHEAALFQNVFKSCRFLPKFSKILPFFALFLPFF